MLNNLKIYMICIAIYYSYQNECKLKKCNKLICNLHDKKECVLEMKNVRKHGDIKLVTTD